MLTVVGQENCIKCKMTRQKLKTKNIGYDYVPFLSIGKEKQEKIMMKAKKKGLLNFPIIIKDGEVIRAEEVFM